MPIASTTEQGEDKDFLVTISRNYLFTYFVVIHLEVIVEGTQITIGVGVFFPPNFPPSCSQPMGLTSQEQKNNNKLTQF